MCGRRDAHAIVGSQQQWRSCVTESSRREVRRQTGIEAELEETDCHFAVSGVDDADINVLVAFVRSRAETETRSVAKQSRRLPLLLS